MLKVGSPQPQGEMMPPMEEPMMQGDFNGGGQPMADPNGTMPPMDDPMAQNGMGDASSEFDTNFDAGVDADENTDPKKYIQQLTGKLSQSLRKYNSNQQGVDAELNKYVAGMILKQSTEGLSSEDKKEIVDKVSDDSENNDQQMDMQEPSCEEQPMMESINNRQIVNELFQELTNGRRNNGQTIAQRPIKNISFRKKPFTAPNMK